MRRLLALTLIAITAAVAACSGSGTTDPYQLAWSARSASWDQVQVDVGVTVKGSTPITIAPGAIRLVADTKAGKGLFHVSLPTSALGTDGSAMLTQLGITGSTLDLDVLYDGNALYAKSPLAPTLLSMLLASSGGVPSGDLTGWLKLASKADVDALGALGALGGLASSIPSTAPMPSVADAAGLKSQLESMGITLTFAGVEQHSGVSANRLTAAVDWRKLAASPYLAAGTTQAQVQAGLVALEAATVNLDLWLDKSSNRVVGVDFKASPKADASQSAEVTIDLKSPDAGTSLDAPSSFVEVPLMQNLSQLIKSFGGGLTPTP
jgi:hypothetical protein